MNMTNQTELFSLLKKYFNYDSFRTGQKEIIDDILDGKNVLGILPTGMGKSLCYQLPALMLEGVSIVVSPLISLMMDQVKELKARHFPKVVAINSFLSYEERKEIYQQIHQYKLIFVSPELLQKQEIMHYLKRTIVSLFVVDEAHCISQWGHEFRPDYLRLTDCLHELNHPTVLALSATATPIVRKEIVDALELSNVQERIYPMDRENIAFVIEKVKTDAEKLTIILNWLEKQPVPTVIYTSTRNEAVEIARYLNSCLSEREIAYYHGGMEQLDRVMIQEQFMNNQIDIICSTSAFGMGINKQNIRLVIHMHPTKDMESYIQEVGRAGRDGQFSTGLLLYTEHDIERDHNLLINETLTKQQLTVIFNMLYQMQSKDNLLPNEKKYENIFQITESQWVFLYYEFEKHGIIKKNKIIFNEANWENGFNFILERVQERYAYKRQKLIDMYEWIIEDSCLRKSLYRHFQEGFKTPQFYCCSNCGYSLQKWETEKQRPSKKQEKLSWQEKLKNIMLIE